MDVKVGDRVASFTATTSSEGSAALGGALGQSGVTGAPITEMVRFGPLRAAIADAGRLAVVGLHYFDYELFKATS